MKYYLIAGEASGDLHGSNLIKALKSADPDPHFRFFGGDKMQEQGENLVRHYKDMAYMGIFDVVVNWKAIRNNLRYCKEDLVKYAPDCIILIDFAGFNLRIARHAREHGIPVFYYISPKVWAWNKSRVKLIRKLVDRMFVILPFEVDFFREHDYEVEFLGNPLVDAIEKFEENYQELDFLEKNQLPDKPVIALLAGSRKHELKYCLPEMLQVIPDFRGYQFVIAGAPGLDQEIYQLYTEGHDVKIIFDQTYELVKYASAAIVASGTATLETALLGTPEVVIYKVGPVTYRIGKLLVKVKFFSLVNLIMDREIVKELFQFNLARDIKNEMTLILTDQAYRKEMMDRLKVLKEKMGKSGVSDRVAQSIYQRIKK